MLHASCLPFLAAATVSCTPWPRPPSPPRPPASFLGARGHLLPFPTIIQLTFLLHVEDPGIHDLHISLFSILFWWCNTLLVYLHALQPRKGHHVCFVLLVLIILIPFIVWLLTVILLLFLLLFLTQIFQLLQQRNELTLDRVCCHVLIELILHGLRGHILEHFRINHLSHLIFLCRFGSIQ